MLLYSSLKFNLEISICFPERGHPFIPPDRAFGRFEKHKRNLKMLCLPEEYKQIYDKVGESRMLGNNFKFYDWATSTRSYLENSKKKIPISKVKVMKFHEGKIGFSTDYFDKLRWYKYTSFMEDFESIKINELPLQNCVKEKKLKDAQDLLKSMGVNSSEINKFYMID